MDLDASWGQGSSRRDFHFVTFQSPFRMGLLSKAARSTTSGPVLALLHAVVLEKIQLLHLPKQQRICVQWSILHRQKFDTFGYFWHSLPRVVDSCGFLWIWHICAFPSISMSNLGATSRTTRLHFSHQTTFAPLSPCLRTGQRALSEYCAIKALRIATRGSGGNSQLN